MDHLIILDMLKNEQNRWFNKGNLGNKYLDETKHKLKSGWKIWYCPSSNVYIERARSSMTEGNYSSNKTIIKYMVSFYWKELEKKHSIRIKKVF